MENSREHLAKAGCFSSEEKMKFYESRKWKKKREHILRRDSYQSICQAKFKLSIGLCRDGIDQSFQKGPPAYYKAAPQC